MGLQVMLFKGETARSRVPHVTMRDIKASAGQGGWRSTPRWALGLPSLHPDLLGACTMHHAMLCRLPNALPAMKVCLFPLH